jgi:hypothetical protein
MTIRVFERGGAMRRGKRCRLRVALEAAGVAFSVAHP